jgi:hypothetical protein
MGLTTQEPLSGYALCVGFGQMIMAWFISSGDEWEEVLEAVAEGVTTS